jgi:hypothetical protein
MGGALVLILFDPESPGPEAYGGNHGETDVDEDFAAVEIIDGAALQVRIGEDAVDEDQCRFPDGDTKWRELGNRMTLRFFRLG